MFGLGLFGVGIAWIHVAVLELGAGLSRAVSATAALVMLLSVFPAAALALGAWVSPPLSARRFGLLPVAWVLCEWLRGWLFTGFPGLQLGYTQTGSDLAPLVAPMTGVLGLSIIVAFFAAGMALGMQSGKRRWLILVSPVLGVRCVVTVAHAFIMRNLNLADSKMMDEAVPANLACGQRA